MVVLLLLHRGLLLLYRGMLLHRGLLLLHGDCCCYTGRLLLRRGLLLLHGGLLLYGGLLLLLGGEGESPMPWRFVPDKASRRLPGATLHGDLKPNL